jgi:hypothetical protein
MHTHTVIRPHEDWIWIYSEYARCGSKWHYLRTVDMSGLTYQ